MSPETEAPPAFRSGHVTIVGRPNVGKSTLTNLLVGQKVAIVSEAPQTTRNRIHGIRNMAGGQIVLVDTPGIHKPQHEMNRRMVIEATQAMHGVDLILFMIEASPAGQAGRGLGPGDRFILSQLPDQGPPVLLVVNKVDRVPRGRLLPLVDRVKDLFPFGEILLISALTGDNTLDLPEKLLAYLPGGPPLFPAEYVTDQPERFLAAEIVREKILHHTRQEIPHEACVLIDAFEEKETGLKRVEATILVERDSQKKIVIGREGSLLKIIGTEARRELEQLLGSKVFLKLWVKARPGWREEPEVLKRLGLHPAS